MAWGGGYEVGAQGVRRISNEQGPQGLASRVDNLGYVHLSAAFIEFVDIMHLQKLGHSDECLAAKGEPNRKFQKPFNECCSLKPKPQTPTNP